MENNGSRTVLKHIYSNLVGSDAAIEEIILETGELADYLVDFPETAGCGRRLERKGETVKSSSTRGDVNKTDEREYINTLAAGPVHNAFIRDKWDDLPEIHGKSLLQRKVDGKIENQVVDNYYTYEG